MKTDELLVRAEMCATQAESDAGQGTEFSRLRAEGFARASQAWSQLAIARAQVDAVERERWSVGSSP